MNGVAAASIRSPMETPGGSEDTVDSDFDIDEDDLTYSMRNENLPDAPIYNKELQSVLRGAKEKLGALAIDMNTCPLSLHNDSDFSSLLQETQRLANFEYPKTRVIGFVGDSGVGKKCDHGL